MRVWDCCPSLLSPKHLGAEWQELHALFKAVLAHIFMFSAREDERFFLRTQGYFHHPETKRFVDVHGKGLNAPALIITRADFVRSVATDRGYNYVAPFEFEHRGQLYNDELFMSKRRDDETWDEFFARSLYDRSWPMLFGGPWSPWKRDGITAGEYVRGWMINDEARRAA